MYFRAVFFSKLPRGRKHLVLGPPLDGHQETACCPVIWVRWSACAARHRSGFLRRRAGGAAGRPRVAENPPCSTSLADSMHQRAGRFAILALLGCARQSSGITPRQACARSSMISNGMTAAPCRTGETFAHSLYGDSPAVFDNLSAGNSPAWDFPARNSSIFAFA